MNKEVKMPQSPFDLYDIFGYIVPGLIFIISIIFLVFIFGADFPINSKLFIDINQFQLIELRALKDNVPWWFEISILITLIVIVYTIGHIIASISSLMVDKYLVKKTAGYPSQRLFNLPKKLEFSTGFYKLIVFLINLFLLLLLFFGMPNMILFYSMLFVLVILITIKTILSGSTSNITEQKGMWLIKIGKIFSFPFNLFVRFLERAISLNESFNPEFIKEFKSKFEKQFNIGIETAGTNLYWLSYCYVIDKNEHLRDVTRHFLRQYGFSRNLGISFYLLFIFSLILRLHTDAHVYRLTWICAIFFSFSLIMLIRYYYLYYNYYSKFIFRAFAYLQTNGIK